MDLSLETFNVAPKIIDAIEMQGLGMKSRCSVFYDLEMRRVVEHRQTPAQVGIT